MTFEEFVAEWIRQAREYGSRGIPQEAIDMAEEAWEQATKQLEERTRLLHAAFKMSRCECDSDEACRNLARLESRVAELEAARGEPVAWQYKVTCDGKGFVDWKAWEQEERPAKIGRWDAEYRALYTAPPAPAVDVDAISDEALMRGASEFHRELDTGGHRRSCMLAALRAIFNKGE